MKKELFFHIIFITAIVFLIAFPMYRKYSFSPANTFYTNPHGAMIDYYTYVSYIRQGRTNLEVLNLCTVEDSKGDGLHLLYPILGRIARYTGIGNFAMYHISMYVALALYYLFSYLIVRSLISNRFQWLAMFIIFFASPFPPVQISLFGKDIFLGTDIWTRMDIPGRLALIPHHFWGIALLVATVYFILEYVKKQNIRWVVGACITSVIGIFVYSVPFFILLSVLGTSTLIGLIHPHLQKETKKILPGIFVISAVILLCMLKSYYDLTHIPMVKNVQTAAWEENMINTMNWEYNTFTPEVFPHTFFLLLVSYGILPLFVLIELLYILRRHSFQTLFCLLFFIFPFLFYFLSIKGFLHIAKIRFVYSAPYMFGGILTVWAIEHITVLLNRGKKTNNLTYYVILVVSSSIFFINAAIGLNYYWKPELYPKNIYYNTYIPTPAIHAVTYIDSHIPKLSKIMTSYFTGMYIPAFTQQRVFIAHELETLNFPEKWWYSNAFFDGSLTTKKAQDMFKNYNIGYIFWDRGDIPEKYRSLVKELFREDWMRVYQVI